MKRFSFFSLVMIGISWPCALRADGYATNITTEKLTASSTAYNGQTLSYNSTSKPEVTALLVHVPPGCSTGWHKHPVPVYAYMVEGEMTISMKDGSSYRFNKGEVILEVMNMLHNGINTGNRTATLIVFYSGTVGSPNVIKEWAVVAPDVSINNK